MIKPDYAELFTAYDRAKKAYSQLAFKGYHRSDRELARDESYRGFLAAGITIARVGGADAVGAASEALSKEIGDGDLAQIDRFWRGLRDDTWRVV